MILVPDTTIVPTSTDAPESTRSGLTTSVNAIAPTTTRATLAGTAIRRKRICWLWRTAARKTRSASARPKRATLRGPSSLASDRPVREVIPRAPNPSNDGRTVPARCEPLWGSMLVPKYGPAAAGTPQDRAKNRPIRGCRAHIPEKLLNSLRFTRGQGRARHRFTWNRDSLQYFFGRAISRGKSALSHSGARNGRKYPRPPSRQDRAGPGRARSESRLRRAPCALRGRGWRRASPSGRAGAGHRTPHRRAAPR